MTEWKIHRKNLKPYWCSICGADDLTEEELKAHKEAVHKEAAT